MAGWADRLRRQPRAVIGLAALALVLWIEGLLSLQDHIDRQAEARKSIQRQIAHLDRVSQEEGWGDLAESARAGLGEIRSRLWRAESEGRMQAQFQDWMRSLAAERGLRLREVAVSQPELLRDQAGITPEALAALPNDWRLLRVRIVLEWEPRSFSALLGGLAETPHWIWIDRLSIGSGPPVMVELHVAGMFTIGSEPER